MVLGINRSDYMLDTEVTEEHQERFVLRQVELNTIAAGLGGMASKIPYLHRYVCWEVPYIEGTIAAVNLGVQRLVWGKICVVFVARLAPLSFLSLFF